MDERVSLVLGEARAALKEKKAIYSRHGSFESFEKWLAEYVNPPSALEK